MPAGWTFRAGFAGTHEALVRGAAYVGRSRSLPGSAVPALWTFRSGDEGHYDGGMEGRIRRITRSFSSPDDLIQLAAIRSEIIDLAA